MDCISLKMIIIRMLNDCLKYEVYSIMPSYFIEDFNANKTAERLFIFSVILISFSLTLLNNPEILDDHSCLALAEFYVLHVLQKFLGILLQFQ